MWCRWIYSAIEKSTNIKVKFCRPHIQLQKNTVQRSNGPEIYPHVPLLLPTVAKEFEFEREGAGRTLKSGHWTLLLQKMRNHILIDQAPWHIPFIGHRRSMHFFHLLLDLAMIYDTLAVNGCNLVKTNQYQFLGSCMGLLIHIYISYILYTSLKNSHTQTVILDK